MSLFSDDAELEGEFEDLEGDADLNEWAAMGEDTSEIFLPKPSEQTLTQSSNKHSHLSKNTNSKTAGGLADQSQSSKDKETCHSIALQAHSDSLPGATYTNHNPPKRKASSGPNEDTNIPKSKKVESDILMAIETSGNQNEYAEEVEDKDQMEEKPSFSQEELRNLDACLVSEMMGGIKKQMFLRMPTGDRFVVAFAPVELADLADPSVQQLIESQPNLAFFFNRQGKFKKKKGYAQAYFTLTSEVRKFMNMLMYVRLLEQSTEVSISAIMNGGKHNVQVSFVLSSNHKSNLVMLLDKEDPDRYVPVSSKVSFQVEKVSTEATASVLMLLFPFASSINFKSEQTKDMAPGHKGPVNIFYVNQQWLDAVMSCCSDFRYNGVPLKVLRKEVPKPEIHKSSILSKRLSLDSDRKSQSNLREDKVDESPNRSRHDSANSNMSGSDKGDDDISNMTLDVCAGMMESLDKLKQMGTDNPNVLKILEMQSQLAALQKSLTKKSKLESTKGTDDQEKTTMADISSEGEPGTETRDKMSKEAIQKTVENKKDNQGNKELEILEAKLQKADEREKIRKQRLQEELEKERKLSKVLEEMRKRNSAKQWIAEARQSRGSSGGPSEAAQKILQSFAEKRQSEQQNEEALKATQQSQAAHGVDISKIGQGSHALSLETIGQRSDPVNQSWNPATSQGPVKLLFQDKFQPMTSFLENFPGNVPASKPIISTPRLGGPDKAVAHQHQRTSGDDGLHSRLEEFQKELAQQGVVSPVKVHENHRSAVSPDRPLHEGAPVYTEKEYHRRRKAEYGHQLPLEFCIQTTFLPNRRCPVQGCPASKNFKTEPMFLDHWDMFHKPTMTMLFCHRCTAYFVHPSELHAHLIKTHSINDHQMASQMVAEARMKIVSNPSYRDPGRFLAPPV